MKPYLEGRLQHAREHGGEGLIAERRTHQRQRDDIWLLLLGAGSEARKTHVAQSWNRANFSRIGERISKILKSLQNNLFPRGAQFVPGGRDMSFDMPQLPNQLERVLARACCRPTPF
jgi:hypothetical protein